jgi:hypothetical protein
VIGDHTLRQTGCAEREGGEKEGGNGKGASHTAQATTAVRGAEVNIVCWVSRRSAASGVGAELRTTLQDATTIV